MDASSNHPSKQTPKAAPLPVRPTAHATLIPEDVLQQGIDDLARERGADVLLTAENPATIINHVIELDGEHRVAHRLANHWGVETATAMQVINRIRTDSATVPAARTHEELTAVVEAIQWALFKSEDQTGGATVRLDPDREFDGGAIERVADILREHRLI